MPENVRTGEKKYFACVQEFDVDENGLALQQAQEREQEQVPAPTREQYRIIYVDRDAPEGDQAEAETEPVDVQFGFADGKRIVRVYVDRPAREKEPVEETEEEPVEEVAEEPVEEQIEEPVEEVAEEDVEEELAPAAAEEEAEEAEEEAVEEPVVFVAEPAAKKKYVNKSFAQKMMAADEVLQDRYDDLKNYALRFKKLKSRISKKFDSLNKGRLQFVKLSVAGKTLKLYLNMDIATVDPKFHCKDVSDKVTYEPVPVLLRIKSGRAVKYAKLLIDQCAASHGLVENKKFTEVDAIALVEEVLAPKKKD